MSKSYDPVHPKPRKAPPEFVRDETKTNLKTDDTDFGPCWAKPIGSHSVSVAWKDGRGRWFNVLVDRARILRGAPALPKTSPADLPGQLRLFPE